MVGESGPRAAQVVRHHVDEVQLGGEPADMVAGLDSELCRRDGGREQPAVRPEGGVRLLHKQREVLLVDPATVAVLSSCEGKKCMIVSGGTEEEKRGWN